MTDNELLTAVIATLRVGYANLTTDYGVTVQQSYQPTHQGMPFGPTLTLHKIGDRRYGFLKRRDVYNAMHVPADFDHEEVQQYETTFQASGIFEQTASDTTGWTASDVANYGAAILQSDWGRLELQKSGIGILRVTDVRNPPMPTNQADEFEFVPNFDFVLTHKQTIVTATPAVTAEELRIRRV
jgi:hypothetical protein